MPFGVLSCPICYCEYDQNEHIPRVIPLCGHTVCSKCLSILLENLDSSKCPLDNNRFSMQQSSLEAFPINFIARQLSEDKASRKLCSNHNEKLRLVCLTDKARICDDCVFSGEHKDHDIKPMKKFQQEAMQKRKELESLSKQLGKYRREVKDMIEERRKSLLQVIKNKFQDLRWLLAKKELELSFEVDSFFDVETSQATHRIDFVSKPVDVIMRNTVDINNVPASEEFLDCMAYDVTELSAKIAPEILDQETQSLSEKFNKLSNEFYEHLMGHVESLSRMKFCEDLKRHVESGNNVSSPDHEVQRLCEMLTTNRLAETLKVELKDDWFVISTVNNSESVVANDAVLNKDWRDVDKVWLKVGKCKDLIQSIQALTYIWKNLKQVSCLKVDFVSKDILDSELFYIFSIVFSRISDLQMISVDFCDCKVGDQSLVPLLEQIFPNVAKVRSLALNLNSTQVTDNTVELLAKTIQPYFKHLESFDLRLWETKVTDKSVVQLFNKMEKVKRFVLDLGYTGVTNESIFKLANITIASMKVLEEFKLGLSKTNVSDESVSQIFIGMETTKHFLLYLHGTNITDKSLEVFAKRTLPTMKTLEVFEMRLGETKVSDQSVIKLFNNMESVRKFILKVQSTSITDKTIETFLRATLPAMKTLEEFEIDVSNTEVTEKYSSQLTRIKEKLSERFAAI